MLFTDDDRFRLARLQELCEATRLSFPSALKLKCELDENERVSVAITTFVPERESKLPTDITARITIFDTGLFVSQLTSDGVMLRFIRWCLTKFVIHELDENIYVNDERVFDPHKQREIVADDFFLTPNVEINF